MCLNAVMQSNNMVMFICNLVAHGNYLHKINIKQTRLGRGRGEGEGRGDSMIHVYCIAENFRSYLSL